MARDRLIYRDELLARCGMSYPTLLSLIRAGKLARGRLLGGRVCWTEGEVAEFIAALPRQRFRGEPSAPRPVLP